MDLYQQTLQAVNLNTWRPEDNRPVQLSTSTGYSQGCVVETDLQAQVLLSGLSSPAKHDFDAVLQLEAMSRRGEHCLACLYTYQSCLRPIKANESGQQASVRCLQQAVDGMWEVVRFCHDAADLLASVCTGHFAPDSPGVLASTSLLRGISRVINIMHLLDTVRAAKPSLLPDTMRMLQLLKLHHKSSSSGGVGSDSLSSSTADSSMLTDLLGCPWGCLMRLRDSLQRVPCVHRMLGRVVQHLHDVLVEKELGYGQLLHPQRHSYLRALPAALVLLFPDVTGDPGLEVIPARLIHRCLKLLRQKPVIPGMGDVPVTLTAVLSQSIFLVSLGQEGKAWHVGTDERQEEKQLLSATGLYAIEGQVASIRSTHDALAEQFAVFAIEAQAHRDHGIDLPAKVAQHALSLSLDILRSVSQWTCLLLELHAWKLTGLEQPSAGNGTAQEARTASGQLQPQPAVAGRAVYTHAELAAMLDIMACAKGLTALVQCSATWINGLIQQAVQLQVQQFLQVTLPAMVKPQMQRKVADALLSLQSACGPHPLPRSPPKLTRTRSLFQHWRKKDTENSSSPQTASKAARSPMLRRAATATVAHMQSQAIQPPPVVPSAGTIPARRVVPTRPQLHHLLHTLEMLLREGQGSQKRLGLLSHADLGSAALKALREMQHQLLHWAPVLDLRNSLQQVACLADLWLSCLSNPEMPTAPTASLPFAMASLGVRVAVGGPMDRCLVTFEVFNDAAAVAKERLGSDDLQACIRLEAALCMDALLPHMALAAFCHFKARSAALLADKAVLDSWPDGPPRWLPELAVPQRWEELCRQSSLVVAGEAVNVAARLAEHVQQLVQDNAAFLVARFEASEVTSLVELEAQVAVLRHGHAVIADLLPMAGWHEMWSAADGRLGSLSRFRSRIAEHAVHDMLTSILPGYTYCTPTQRFVHSLPLNSHASQCDDDATAGPSSVHSEPGRDHSRMQHAQHGPDHAATCPAFLYGPEGSPDGPFGMWAAAYRGFFGPQHLDAFLALTGPAGAALLIKHIQQQLQHILLSRLAEDMQDLLSVLDCGYQHQASNMYGAMQLFQHHQRQLGQVALSRPDRQRTLHSLTVLGNGMALLSLLDATLAVHASSAFMQAAPLLGLQPDPAGGPQLVKQAPGEPTPLMASLLGPDIAGVLDAQDAAVSVAEALMQQAEAACRQATQPATILPGQLRSLQAALHGNLAQWDGPAPRFHQAFSALLFALCHPAGLSTTPSWPGLEDQPEPAQPAAMLLGPLDLGDGLLWGAAIIIHLLGQRAAFHLSDACTAILEAAAIEGLKGQDPATAALRAFIPLASHTTSTMEHAFRFMDSLHPSRPAAASIGFGGHSAQLYYEPDPLPFAVPQPEAEAFKPQAAPRSTAFARLTAVPHVREPPISATALSTPQEGPQESLVWERQSCDNDNDDLNKSADRIPAVQAGEDSSQAPLIEERQSPKADSPAPIAQGLQPQISLGQRSCSTVHPKGVKDDDSDSDWSDNTSQSS